MKKSLVLSISTAFLIIAAIVVLISLLTKKEAVVITEDPFSEVERTKNLLRNSSFENQFTKNDWQLNKTAKTIYGFDRFSVKHGEFSLAIQNEEYETTLLSQSVDNLQQEKKYIFFGFIKSEELDSVFVSINVFDKNDDLLFAGQSQVLKNNFDWTLASTWIRTQDERISHLVVKVTAAGKGKVWLDDFNLYVMPIDYKFNLVNFQKLGL